MRLAAAAAAAAARGSKSGTLARQLDGSTIYTACALPPARLPLPNRRARVGDSAMPWHVLRTGSPKLNWLSYGAMVFADCCGGLVSFALYGFTWLCWQHQGVRQRHARRRPLRLAAIPARTLGPGCRARAPCMASASRWRPSAGR